MRYRRLGRAGLRLVVDDDQAHRDPRASRDCGCHLNRLWRVGLEVIRESQQQEQQPSNAPSAADVSACLKRSEVGYLVRDVTLEPDPLDNGNSDVLRIETTVAPGQYEGDQGAIAVGLAASDCGSDQLGVAVAVIDRDGNDMGQ